MLTYAMSKWPSLLIFGASLTTGAFAAEQPTNDLGPAWSAVVSSNGEDVIVKTLSPSADAVTCDVTLVAVATDDGQQEGITLTKVIKGRVVRANRTLDLSVSFKDQLSSKRGKQRQQDDLAKRTLSSVDLASSQLICTTIDESTQDLWVDDNRTERLAVTPDMVRKATTDAADKVIVSFAIAGSANYVRLCDAVLSLTFSSPQLGVSQTEYAYQARKLFLPGQLLTLAAQFERADQGNGRLKTVRGSEHLSMSCLRWTGETLPDLATHVQQRPAKLPNQVCDPAKEEHCTPLTVSN